MMYRRSSGYEIISRKQHLRRRRRNRTIVILFLMICFILILLTILNGKKRFPDFRPLASNAVTQEKDWNLILVNHWNPIPDNYQLEKTQLQNGHSVDSRIYPSLQEMFDDARAAGLLPYITSSYRTSDYQQQLLDEEIAKYEGQGNSREEAEKIAVQWVAIPGTSEHELGIAVDISSADPNTQDPSVVWDWLNQNSYKYGFILRYPEDKTDLTGVNYEPWHYRYVGKQAAKEIYERGICLEEYLAVF